MRSLVALVSLLALSLACGGSTADPVPVETLRGPEPDPAPALDPPPALVLHGEPPGSCDEWSFPTAPGPLLLGEVTRGPRLHFHDASGAGCPAGPDCERGAYLVPGDRVLVAGVGEGFACAWFSGGAGVTVGWLPADGLTARAHADAGPVGAWGARDADLAISREGEQLLVSGTATWMSGSSVHVGELDREVLVEEGDALLLDTDWGCHVRLRTVDRWLVVDDNNHCGGANVSFTGVYQRSP